MSEDKIENIEKPKPIETLRDAVRLRTGMYFGTTNSYALYIMLLSVLGHSVNEAYLGTCDQINITFHEGNVVTVRDNGHGIALETNPETRQPFYTLSPNEKPGEMTWPEYKFQVSRLGMALPVVNAVSKQFDVQVKRRGYLWQQRFAEGLPLSLLEQIRPLQGGETTGTQITFSPDSSIFPESEFDYHAIVRRLHEVTYLIPRLKITIEDLRPNAPNRDLTLGPTTGLGDFVRYLNRACNVLHEPIEIYRTIQLHRNYEPLGYSGTFNIVLQYTDVHQPVILSFMNGFEIECKGPHIDGLLRALHISLISKAHEIAPTNSFDEYGFTDDDVLRGLTIVISMQHPKPETCNSIYFILSNPEVKDAIVELLLDEIEIFAETYPDQMKRIAEQCLSNKILRLKRRYEQ